MAKDIETLSDNAADATGTVDAFNGALSDLQRSMADTMVDTKKLQSTLSRDLRQAIDGVVFDGTKLSTALRGIGQSIAQATYDAAAKPVTDHFGGLLAGGLTSALGGGVQAFAKGGVLDSPTAFPMQRGGIGLMGEAGPEAIMPLTRGADGRLGVRAQGGGGGGVQVTMNINTPDATSFQRSQSQIAAQMRRAMLRGRRNT